MDIRNTILIFAVILTGCTTSVDVSRNIFGLYTVSLENSPHKDKVLEYPYNKVYDATLAALKEMSLYIPIQNKRKGMMVATGFTRANETTEVGIFFKKLEPQKTQVYIASKNPYLLERASSEIFLKLEKRLN